LNAPGPVKTGSARFGAGLINCLRNPSYLLYFFGTIAHFAAMSMQIVTGPLLIYRLTDSPGLLGTMSLVGSLPMILISVYGGAIADRMQKKKILVAGLIGSATVSLCIGLALITGLLSKDNTGSWWILFACSFVQGIIMGLMMPALQAIIPEIVNRNQLMNAIALNTLGMNILNLAAPMIAGFVIDSFGFQIVYFSMSGLYICAAVFISFIPAGIKAISSSTKIVSEIQQGFQYIRKDFLILFILAFTFIVVVLSMPYQTLMPIFTEDILKVGARGLGALMGMAGLGALLGSIILALLPNKKRGILLLSSGILAGVSLIVFSFSRYMGLSMVFIFFIGLSQTFRMTIGNALLQSSTQGPYMGRVMSILNMQWGFMSVCTFFAGILAEIVPVQWVLGGLAALLAVLSILFLIFVPKIRKMD
jgi:MFS family permease